jgi:hypothetical protein
MNCVSNAAFKTVARLIVFMPANKKKDSNAPNAVSSDVLERIRAARQPVSKHLADVAAGKVEPLHVGTKNVRILLGRKRRAGLRTRIRKRFAGLMHRVITPSPAAPLQVTSFRGLPEISGVAGGIERVVKAAIGDDDAEEKPKTLRIVGLRIS